MLTDEQCQEYRTQRGDFNTMLRTCHAGGVAEGIEAAAKIVEARGRECRGAIDPAITAKAIRSASGQPTDQGEVKPTRRHCQGCDAYYPTVSPHPHGNRVCHMDAEGTCERVKGEKY